MIVLYYIFAKYYQFFSFFDEDDAGFTAMMAMCLWMFMIIMNGIALLIHFDLLDPKDLYPKTVTGITIAITLVIINYFLFVTRNKYSVIAGKFSNESDSSWILGAISVTIVTALPFYLVFYHAVPYLIETNA